MSYEPEAMTPQVLMAAVMNAVSKDPFVMPAIDLGGLGRIRTRVRTLLDEKIYASKPIQMQVGNQL